MPAAYRYSNAMTNKMTICHRTATPTCIPLSTGNNRMPIYPLSRFRRHITGTACLSENHPA